MFHLALRNLGVRRSTRIQPAPIIQDINVVHQPPPVVQDSEHPIVLSTPIGPARRLRHDQAQRDMRSHTNNQSSGPAMTSQNNESNNESNMNDKRQCREE